MSGLFPGSSTNEKFWENLMEEKDLIQVANEHDFGVDPNVFFQDGKGVVDKCYSTRGGYIRDFKFDPNGYQLPADFLAKQDKLYQWSLYVAKQALKDSGYLDNKNLLKKCGLILGNLSFPTASSHKLLASLYTDTLEHGIQELIQSNTFKVQSHKWQQPENEVIQYTPSQMVVEALGLQSNHYALDAACATSLYAVKLASDELQTGQSDMMLAGAVCASDQLFIHMGFSIFHAYAENDKKFVPLDKNSAGLVSSEGAGMVVLKRLEDAERDGDNILGVIGGIGLSNDGKGKFLLSPNPKGQKLAFERAYDGNKIHPKDTHYLECHATGTPLGDMTEINSIAEFFKLHQTKPILGSVKSNMGHLLTAAGMPGMMKVLLSMQKNTIPPNINLTESLSSDNNWIGGSEMIAKAVAWNGDTKQAGINSFGFGGTNAHMVIQSYPLDNQYSNNNQPISLQPMIVTGMDVHFGNCKNLTEFYSTIYNGKQHFTDLPSERWKGFDQHQALLKSYGFENGEAPKGAYIDHFEIDLLRYKIQPKEAETLEPQQALILKVADQAIQDAELEEGQNVAVLIAMEPELGVHQYLARWDVAWQLDEAIERHQLPLNQEQITTLEKQTKNAVYHLEGKQTPSQHTSFVGNIMASRIAALWDFSGPAFTVSCGDNSVLKALQIAQNLLSLGEVDAVVVGGVDCSGGIENVLLRQHKNAINQNNNPSLSLNQSDEGWLIGEGAGAIVLKRADSNNTKSYGCIDKINKVATNESLAIGYQELVGSGIAAEDQQEIESLLQQSNSLKQKVALGSIKTNIGHTYAASGIAGLIKTLLCLHHQFIPGIPNWNEPKNKTQFNDSSYYFPTQSRPWILQNGVNKRIAKVNGLDGISLQVSETPYVINNDNTFLLQQLPKLFPLKGNDEKELQTQLSALEIALDNNENLAAIAQQFYQIFQEKAKSHCLVLVANSIQSIRSEIMFFKSGLNKAFQNNQILKTPKGSFFTPQPFGKNADITFVYPGSSTAYEGLGKELFQLFPHLNQQYADLKPSLDTFVNSDYLFPKTISINSTKPNIYNNSIGMMSVGVFYAACYTNILREVFNVQPNKAFGYSMGECSSMWYALEVWSPDETKEFRNSPIFKDRFAGELALLAEHWNTTTEVAKTYWVSLVLLAPKNEVIKLVQQYDEVYLTFINTDNEIIISGNKEACLQIAQQLNCKSIKIPFQNVIHHDFCEKEEKGLLKMHNFPIQSRPAIDFYSSISQDKIPLDSLTIAKNSTQVCFEKVNFPKTVQTVYNTGARIFIEVGAGSTCTNWIQTILKDQAHTAIAINKKGKSDAQSIVEILATLLSHGLDIDLSSLYPKEKTVVTKRSFFKKIILGGKRVFELLLNPEMKTLFANVDHSTPPNSTKKQLVLETISSEVQASTVAVIPNQKNKSISFMETNLVEQNNKTTQSSSTVAENGLKKQNFAAGEQLKNKEIIFSQEDLVEFANGKIANVFGPEYSVIDSYRRRVMLPMDPYLLVSRVTGLNAKLGEYKPSTMQTEYDIPYNAWFTTDGQIPWAVSVESGQCDLLLISYLGIDFQNKGDLVYRLLDCTLTFVDDLPYEGQTLRYDISINSFVENADNLLFFFSYKCYVEDRLVLKMDGGCAGFFNDQQLQEGNGVVYSEKEIHAKANAERKYFSPMLKTDKTSFSKEDLRHLINGDIDKCFGNESYYPNGKNPSLRLPPEKMLMLDRITSVDLKGGAYGLGLIIAEKDLAPDDWYFPCHFRDDEVLAGSLQAEGGGNLLRFYMMMLGLQRFTKDARFQPVFDLAQKVRCRKQVVPGKDTKLIYKLEIKEISLIPYPHVIGDLEIISDGVITVHFENLGLQLREKDNPKYLETNSDVYISPRSEGALMNEKDITTFALDDLSKCFGPEYKLYDGRAVSHQPNTDLQLISRVLSVDGERHDFSKPSTIISEYDVPHNVWYYDQNANITMPYSMIMEIALQPCGLLGAYLGSTFEFPEKNLFLRNLDGEGTSFDLPTGTDFRGKVITNKSVLISSIGMGGTILQHYTFELSIDGHTFYKGKSSFGFFTAEMLSAQVGLDNGKMIQPWFIQQQLKPTEYLQIKLDSLYGKMKLYKAPENKAHYRLASDQLNLLDKLIIAKNRGEFGKGYIHATRQIHTYDWFFTCHFYEDPVMPGSLGVEAILQAMQVFALQQDLGKDFNNPTFVQLENHKTVWKYRGQILLHVKEMQLEVHIKTIEMRGNQLAIVADASLWNDEVRIYQVTDLSLGIQEA